MVPLLLTFPQFSNALLLIAQHQWRRLENYEKIDKNSDQNISLNILRPIQNGRHFTDNIFKCIFLNENAWILVKIALKYVPKGPIDNIPALV